MVLFLTLFDSRVCDVKDIQSAASVYPTPMLDMAEFAWGSCEELLLEGDLKYSLNLGPEKDLEFIRGSVKLDEKGCFNFVQNVQGRPEQEDRGDIERGAKGSWLSATICKGVAQEKKCMEGMEGSLDEVQLLFPTVCGQDYAIDWKMWFMATVHGHLSSSYGKLMLSKESRNTRPIKALTVYHPNTPANAFVPRVLPTKSQSEQSNIFTLRTTFFQKLINYEKRITPNWDHSLTKKLKKLSDAFDELEAELDKSYKSSFGIWTQAVQTYGTGDYRQGLYELHENVFGQVIRDRSLVLIMGYGDYVIGVSVNSPGYSRWNRMGHKICLLSVNFVIRFEVAFHECILVMFVIRIGVELLKGFTVARILYTISVFEDMMIVLPNLLAYPKHPKNKSWLWPSVFIPTWNFVIHHDLASIRTC
ncbi:hypothetical protein Tco_0597161 [Tanacetum coccineum]